MNGGKFLKTLNQELKVVLNFYELQINMFLVQIEKLLKSKRRKLLARFLVQKKKGVQDIFSC